MLRFSGDTPSSLYQLIDEGEKIGKGTYGDIYFHDDKVYKVAKTHHEFSQDEEEIIRFLSKTKEINPHIVRIYFLCEKQKYYCMEYCEHYLADQEDFYGNQKQGYLSKINDNTKNRLYFQLCMGVLYLKQNNMCHLDLKANNIMVNSHGVLKIIDFSLSKIASDDGSITLDYHLSDLVTPAYFSSMPFYVRLDGFKIDIWSLGNLYHLFKHSKYKFGEVKDCTYGENNCVFGCDCKCKNYDRWKKGLPHMREDIKYNPKEEEFYSFVMKSDLDNIPTIEEIIVYFQDNFL